eukprot:s1078_g12.t1
MGVHPDHRHLAVIFFHGADGKPKFFVANSLMFGSTAAVYSFNRVSRSLWFLLNRMLMIPCGVFYDDFPLFSPSELASDADESASALLDILGWKHARTGPKGLPFSSKFQVLGCSLDLSHVAKGELILENKPGRLDRLQEHLAKIKLAGRISLHEGQVLHGLLRYACGFFAGRHLYQVCAEVLNLVSGSSGGRLTNVADFCDYASKMLSQSKPRTISAFGERRPILVFTDGSWESEIAGIGAVVIDTATGDRWIFSGRVPEVLICHWKKLVGDQLICQIELYAMVVVRWMFKDRLKDRRAVWWVDNEAARFSTIKGLSPSWTMRVLVREFYSFEVSSPSFSWIERVPSFSNPADGASRDSPGEVMKLLGINACLDFDHPEELLHLLTTA